MKDNEYVVLYKFKEGNVIPLGWYCYKQYTTLNRAKNTIKKFKKYSYKKLSELFKITEKQAETIQFHIYPTKKKLEL